MENFGSQGIRDTIKVQSRWPVVNDRALSRYTYGPLGFVTATRLVRNLFIATIDPDGIPICRVEYYGGYPEMPLKKSRDDCPD